uniref:Integrase core domain containing protein n=1 Tax=Solanum tuberosum TaxID=4113 RepID=M1DL13_SOLTU
MRGIPNHHIEDESLKEYFYPGHDDNGKAVLDTIAGGQGNQGRNYGNYNREGQYVRDGKYNRDNNYNRNNYGNRNDRVGPYVPPQNRDSAPREVGGMSHIEDMIQKMMRKFDATDENVKDMRNDLSGIGQKVDAHAVLIKHLELQITQLSMKQSSKLQSVSTITYRVESVSEVQVEERLGIEALAAVMMHFDSEGIEEYDELVATLDKYEYWSKPKKLELDMKNRESPPARPSVEKAPKLEL